MWSDKHALCQVNIGDTDWLDTPDFQFMCKQFEPAHEVSVLIAYATSEGSGEPAHPRSLARAFAVRTHEVWKVKR